MERIKHYTLKLLTIFLALTLALSSLAMIVLNSGVLDQLAKERSIALFNSKFFGRLEIDELHLKFPNKVILTRPRIYGIGEKTPALEARTLSLKINVLSLLQPHFTKLYLTQLTADSVKAHLMQERDEKLNLEHIFARRNPDPKKRRLEYLFCKSVRLTNSELFYSAKLQNQEELQLAISKSNLELTDLHVKKKFVKGVLQRLQCTFPQRDVTVQQASGQFLFSESRTELLSLKVSSNKSHAELSATLDHFNIFSRQRQQELFRGDSFLNLQEISIDSDDLKRFSPTLALPAGLYTLKGNARGKKENIEILDAALTHRKSRIALHGQLLNLQSSNAFAFELQCDSSKIAKPLLAELLKESKQKEIAGNIGDITFLGNAKGTLNSVKGELTTFSALGKTSLKAEGERNAMGEIASKGTFVLKEIKPHLLVNSSQRKSLLNASGSFAATMSGKELRQLQGEMKLANSFWQNQPINDGAVSLNYDNRTLKSTVSLNNDQTKFTLESEIDWKEQTPRYRASGNAERLDLAKLLVEQAVTTNLNGIFSIQGSGFDPKIMNVAGVVQFSPSSINSMTINDRAKASIDIAQNATSSRATIKSDFVDLFADANCSFDDLITLGTMVKSGVAREINAQNIWRTNLSPPPSAEHALKKPCAITYRIAVKESAPLALLFPAQKIDVQGSAEGEANYADGNCSIGSSIQLATLRLGDTVAVENLSATVALTCNERGVPKASISGGASSFTVARTTIGTTTFSGDYTPAHLETSINLNLPAPAQNLSAAWSIEKNESGYDLRINQLTLKENNGIWKATPDAHIILSKTAATFNHVAITNGAQQAMLNGELGNSPSSSFECTLSTIELSELTPFAKAPSLKKLAGTINASLFVTGAAGSQTSEMKVSGKNIRYDAIAIGTLQATALHRGNEVRFEIRTNAQTTEQAEPHPNTIEGGGTIPLTFSLYPLRIGLEEQQTMNASFRSENLSGQFLEYLSPLFASVEGAIQTSLQVRGTVANPDLYLTAHLHNTNITVEPTQASYRLNGKVYATLKTIDLQEVVITDSQHGSGKINGTIKLDKLQPKNFYVVVSLDKLLLFDKKETDEQSAFGTMSGSTKNILLYGTLTTPVIEGSLMIDAANVSLYRSVVDDNAKYVGVSRFLEFGPRYPAQSGAEPKIVETPTKATEFYHSLVDIVQINNLKLGNVEPLKYTMIFDRNRGEHLETSVNDLSLIVNKKNQRYNIFGSVNIIAGKYKFSNSNFDLQDRGKIAWNNVDIRGGVIENLYGSKYVSVSNLKSGDRDNITMLLAITGTINDPKVAMGYYLNEQSQPYASGNTIGGRTSQVDTNAELNVISMLLSKQWYARPGSTVPGGTLAISSAGFSASTGILSSRLSKVVQDIGGLESFNVNVGMDSQGALSGLDLYVALNMPGTDGKMRFIGTGSSPDLNNSAFSDYYGSSQKIEYRITPKVYVEASRSFGQIGSTISSSNLQKPAETWGVSLSYKEQFETWREFWKHLSPASGEKR